MRIYSSVLLVSLVATALVAGCDAPFLPVMEAPHERGNWLFAGNVEYGHRSAYLSG